MADLREKLLKQFEGMGEAVRRFPLSALCAALSCGLLLYIYHSHIKLDGFNVALSVRLLILSVAGFFISINMTLAREVHLCAPRAINAVGLVLILLFGSTLFVFTSLQMVFFCTVLLAALIAMVSLTPYLNSRDDLSYWFFSRQVWQGTFYSGAAAIVVGVGVSLILVTLKTLFGVSFGHKIYGDIWLLALFGFAPFYALSWIPERFAFAEEDCHAPKQLSVFLNWIGAPLLMIYMGILYAYFVKAAMMGQVTVNSLSWMILIYGMVGVTFIVSAWPMRKTGHWTTRMMGKYFFPALIIPAALSTWLIVDRVAAFGVTEQRYLVLAGSLYLLVLSVVFTFKRDFPLRFISLFAVITAIIISLPVVGAYGLSKISQTARLEAALAESGYFEGETYKIPEKLPEFAERKNITSIADYLKKTGKKEEIEKITGAKIPDRRSYKFAEIFGFEAAGKYSRAENTQGVRYTVNFDKKDIVSGVNFSDGYDASFSRTYFNLGKSRLVGGSYKDKDKSNMISSHLRAAKLTIEQGDDSFVLAEFDLSALVKALRDKASAGNQQEKADLIQIASKDGSSSLLVQSVSGMVDGQTVTLNRLNGTIRFNKGSKLYKAVTALKK